MSLKQSGANARLRAKLVAARKHIKALLVRNAAFKRPFTAAILKAAVDAIDGEEEALKKSEYPPAPTLIDTSLAFGKSGGRSSPGL